MRSYSWVMGKGDSYLVAFTIGIVAVIAYGATLGPIMRSRPKPEKNVGDTMGEQMDLRFAAYYYWQANGKLPTTADNASFTKEILKDNKVNVDWQWWLNAHNEFVDRWGTPLRIS